jgi:hypothetical protein
MPANKFLLRLEPKYMILELGLDVENVRIRLPNTSPAKLNNSSAGLTAPKSVVQAVPEKPDTAFFPLFPFSVVLDDQTLALILADLWGRLFEGLL